MTSDVIARPAEVKSKYKDKAVKYKDLVDLGLDLLAIEKLECADRKLTESESLKCMLSCIDVGTKKTAGARGSSLLAVLGSTGAGKSTTINFLCGCEMERKSKQSLKELGIRILTGSVVGVKGLSEGGRKDEVAAIGHSMESRTFIPSLVPAQRRSGDSVMICDCPGFTDNRGFEINIANAVNTCNTLQSAESVRVLFLVDFKTLQSRAEPFSAVKAITGLFGDEDRAQQHVESIYIGFTKVENDATISDLREILDDPQTRCPKLLKDCVSMGNAAIVDPLMQHGESLSADELLERLVSIKRIAGSRTAIRTSLSAIDKEAIGDLTAPFLQQITEGIGEDSYPDVKRLLQSLSKLQVLRHQRVDDVLMQAEDRVRQALQDRKTQISDVLLREQDPPRKAAELKRLLFEKLEGAMILDDYFGRKKETPVGDAVKECREKIEAHERDAVRRQDELIDGQINSALSAFEAEVHKDDSTSGDLFKELDRKTSGEMLRLVREQNSQIPAPPRGSLGLAELGEVAERLAAAVRQRPGSYCLVQDVQPLLEMRRRMRQKFLEHLETGVRLTMQKWYDLALSRLQHRFSDVVEDPRHCAAILESKGECVLPRDFSRVQAWFGTNIADPLRKVTAWAATRCTVEQRDELKRRLSDKMAGLFQRAQEHHRAVEAARADRWIGDHSITGPDLAEFSVQLNEKLQFLEEAGKQAECREQVERLQKKFDSYCSKNELQTKFADGSFQQLRSMLLDAKKVHENIAMLRVPYDALTGTFKSLLLEERALAERQMRDRETEDNDSIKKFSNILKIFSVRGLEEEFFAEFKVARGEFRGIPWGLTDSEIIADACRFMLAMANQKKFDSVAQKLVKYQDVTNLLVAGHKNGAVFRDVFKAGVEGLAHATDKEYVVHSIGESLHAFLKRDGVAADTKRLAREIIESFAFFGTASVRQFNEIASGMSFDRAVAQVRDLDGQPALFPPGGRRSLAECFGWFRETYDDLMNRVLQPGARNKEAQQRVIRDIRINCDALGRKIGMTKNFSREPARRNASMLIGNLFAMWSLAASGTAYADGDRSKMVQPHDPQVLAVLHLLGIGLGGPVRNHIAEVGTGEGKSVCLGILGAFFRLLGFEVSIVCYSSFLSRRDEEAFKPLFDKLGVAPSYSEMGELCEKVLLSGDVDSRMHVESVLTQTRAGSPGSSTASSECRILLIDEVDVFFGENFYGQFYTAAAILEDTECVNLVKYVWEHRRNESLTANAVLRTREARELQRKFPGMSAPLLRNIIEQLLRDVAMFRTESPNYEFKVGRDEDGRQRVGYVDEVSGVVRYNQYFGYRTAFAFAHAKDVSKRFDTPPTKEEIDSMMAVNLKCGMVPYAGLPNFFGVKLGLTGSLRNASERERLILKSRYNFSAFSIMPSIFQKQGLRVEGPDVVSGNLEAEYYGKIKDSIREKSSKGGAVLAVFQDRGRLQGFKEWLRQHPYSDEPDLHVLSGDEKEVDKLELISAAARSRRVTLINRPFGRGSDFVCRDSAVKNAGGLHVIQTFPCDLKSEEVQIQGRTCRQDNPGSYRQIILLDDLKPFGINGEAGRTEFEAQQASEGLTWTGFIDRKREGVLLHRRFKKIDAALVDSEERYAQTQSFIQAAAEGEWQKATDLLIRFNTDTPQYRGKLALPRAVIFVVDRTEESILDPCIDSVKFIVKSHLSDTDKIGLYGLGEGWVIAPSSKGDVACTISAKLNSAKKVSGKCTLYRSMLHAVRMLSTFEDHHRWLVVLTDTVDLEDSFGEHEWEAKKKVLALHPSSSTFSEGTIEGVGSELSVRFAGGGSRRVKREDAQPLAEKGDAAEAVAMDPDTVQKLRLAGARKGTLRVALDWKSKDDLDLHVKLPDGQEISYLNREAGGGTLDVDQNRDHDTTDAVENIYFDCLPQGTYEVWVEFFSPARTQTEPEVAFSVWLATQLRVHVSGPSVPRRTVSGTTMKFRTKVTRVKEKRHVFSFTYDGPTDGLSGATFDRLREELRRTRDMSMAIVDCSQQSAWNRDSAKWSSFKRNIEECLKSVQGGTDNDTYHLEASNQQAISESFQKIVSHMIIPGTGGPRRKTPESKADAGKPELKRKPAAEHGTSQTDKQRKRPRT